MTKALAARAARSPRDAATRERLLAAATELFAKQGFRRVTVRAICRAASANVAAVNYHFGDKQRLYGEVVEAALASVRRFADLATSPPAGAGPEERLSHYVRAHLVRGADSSAARQAATIRELFRHEFTEPTGAAPRLVEQALAPRWRYLGQIVTEVLGGAASPAVVADCVLSVQAQCLLPLATPVAFSPVRLTTSADRERLVAHVVRFSLAGIREAANRALPRAGKVPVASRSKPRRGRAAQAPG